MSNRGELRSKLRTEIKIDPNGKIWNDPTLNDYIRQAYIQVQKDGNYAWRENDAYTTISVLSGTQEYALPSDFGKVELIRLNNTELLKTDLISLKRRYSTFASGLPSQYYIRGANVGFNTIPNVTQSADFYYRKRLTTFTADADESAFNEDFDTAIIKYAAYLAWSSPRGNEQTASIKKSEYEIELDTLRSSYIYDDLNDMTFGMTRRGKGITQATVLDR